MKKANSPTLDEDELVAALRNSTLPTLLVEGRSDMEIFNAIEELCFDGGIDILPVNGRRVLINLYERRLEYSGTPVAFLADSDMYIFSGHPDKLSDVVFTSGYSIENDLLQGGKALRMINSKHGAEWKQILEILCHWFSSVVHRHMAGEVVEYSQHPSQIVDFASGKLMPTAQAVLVKSESLSAAAKVVFDFPLKCIRGHTLLNALGHFLAQKKQRPQCSKDMLIRLDLVSWESNPSLSRLITEIRAAIPNKQ